MNRRNVLSLALLAGLARRLPALTLRVIEDQTERLLASLRDGALDAALIALPADAGGVTEIGIYEEDFLLALPPGHPLSGKHRVPAAALAQLLLDARQEREDPGALRVLRQYERWRKSEVAFMSSAIDAFDRFLAHGRGPLSKLAQRGLGWVNRSQELKRFFIARALGTGGGELPRVAQR